MEITNNMNQYTTNPLYDTSRQMSSPQPMNSFQRLMEFQQAMSGGSTGQGANDYAAPQANAATDPYRNRSQEQSMSMGNPYGYMKPQQKYDNMGNSLNQAQQQLGSATGNASYGGQITPYQAPQGGVDPYSGQMQQLSRYAPPTMGGGVNGSFGQGPYSYNLPNAFGATSFGGATSQSYSPLQQYLQSMMGQGGNAFGPRNSFGSQMGNPYGGSIAPPPIATY